MYPIFALGAKVQRINGQFDKLGGSNLNYLTSLFIPLLINS